MRPSTRSSLLPVAPSAPPACRAIPDHDQSAAVPRFALGADDPLVNFDRSTHDLDALAGEGGAAGTQLR